MLFQRVSLIAPLVNLLMVPWFSLVLVPLLLAGTLLLPVAAGSWVLGLGEYLLGVTVDVLKWAADWSLASWQPGAAPAWVWGPAADLTIDATAWDEYRCEFEESVSFEESARELCETLAEDHPELALDCDR